MARRWWSSILDAAGQKGTGKWTAIAALEEGVPLTLISEAVCGPLPVRHEGRTPARSGRLWTRNCPLYRRPRRICARICGRLCMPSKIVSYAQGYALMRDAARHYGWNA